MDHENFGKKEVQNTSLWPILNKDWFFVILIIVSFTSSSILWVNKHNSELKISGDVVHQITTALSQMDPSLYTTDYVYSSRSLTAFYSPIQIETIKILYGFTGKFSSVLALMGFFYGIFYSISAFFLLRFMGFSPLVSFLFLPFFSSRVSIPTVGGWVTGIFTFLPKYWFIPVPTIDPYNWIFSKCIYMILLGVTFFKLNSASSYFFFYLAVGAMFSIHAPVGFNFLFGASLLFFSKLSSFSKGKKMVFIFFTMLFFSAGAFPFLVTYFQHFPSEKELFSLEEQNFFYNFAQLRFPNSYPPPIYRVFQKIPIFCGLPHFGMLFITILGIYGWYKNSPRVQLVFVLAMVLYFYLLKAIPLIILGLFFISEISKGQLESLKIGIYRFFLLSLGCFFTVTWGEWAQNIFCFYTQKPPSLIDHARFQGCFATNGFFLVFLLFFQFMEFHPNGKKKWFIGGLLIVSSVFFAQSPFEEQVKGYSNQYFDQALFLDTNPRFEINDSEYSEILNFAQKTPKETLFIFLDSQAVSWYFRFHSRRSIGINFSDMVWLYWTNKKKLCKDWQTSQNLLEAYREKNIYKALREACKVEGTFLVFPKTLESAKLAVQSGESYVIVSVPKQTENGLKLQQEE